MMHIVLTGTRCIIEKSQDPYAEHVKGSQAALGIQPLDFGVRCFTVMMMMSFICSCRNKNQPKAIYPKGTSHHTRLFRGPSTNDMKK